MSSEEWADAMMGKAYLHYLDDPNSAIKPQEPPNDNNHQQEHAQMAESDAKL